MENQFGFPAWLEMIIGGLDIDPLSSTECFSPRACPAPWTPSYVIWIPMHVSTNALMHVLTEKMKRVEVQSLERTTGHYYYLMLNVCQLSFHGVLYRWANRSDKRVKGNIKKWGEWSPDRELDGVWMINGTRKSQNGNTKGLRRWGYWTFWCSAGGKFTIVV